MSLDNILIHLGEERSKYFNAVAPPIIQSSNFVFDDISSLRNAILDESNTHIYTRGNNPTVSILRKKIAALEKAEDALIVGSGASAAAIAITGNLKSGDHVICIDHPYSWTRKLFSENLSRWDIEVDYIDGRDIENISAAIQENTTLLFLESPNSITFELQDLKACAALAKQHNIVTVIDNSYCSPIFQNPIELGIDIVIHSGTKYLNGHSDVVVGVICSTKEMILKLFKNEYMTYGTIISPHDASLVIRGLRTLEMRMHKIQKVTMQLVDWLAEQKQVKQVLYPFHSSFPQLSLAKEQMRGGSGLFSMILNTDKKSDVEKFINALNNFIIAVSWGGHESLCMPFLAFHDMLGYPDHHVDWRLVRMSVGFESFEYLKEDIEQALGEIGQ